MPVKPIDLQVNFSQISNVGREQSDLANSLVHRQQFMERQSEIYSLESEKRVNKPNKEQSQLKLLNEKNGDGKSKYSNHNGEQKKQFNFDEENEMIESENRSAFDDVFIGNNLDLKG